MRLINGEFKDYYDPTIEDSYMKNNYMVDDKPISLEIMDTAGQDTFLSMRNTYYQNMDGFVFVYSVIDKSVCQAISFTFFNLLYMSGLAWMTSRTVTRN